jgi:hypothetical protein
VVRDAVHGDIQLAAAYLPVLDAREMQRLRGIRQLGTAFHVYPTAQHSRFEHCLGTYHMTGRMLAHIRANHAADPGSCALPTEEEARLARLAALVHDIAHIPYGHAFEDQDGLLPRHDTRPRLERALAGGEIAAALEPLGGSRAVVDCLAPDPDSPAGDARPPVPAPPGGARPFVRDLVAGSVSADLLDYLRRDALFTGLRVSYDERLLDACKVDPESGRLYFDLTKHGMEREDVLSELLNLFRIRYICSERIYYHHAKVASGALVSRAIELCLASGMDPRHLERATDADFPYVLRAHVAERAPAPGTPLASVPRLLARFTERKLPKRCFVAGLRGHETVQDALVRQFVDDREGRRALEAELAATLAIDDPADVVIYCPKKEMQLGEAGVIVRRVGETLRPLDDDRRGLPMLDHLMRAYRDLWKLYVLIPAGACSDWSRATRRVEEVLGARFPGVHNVYRPVSG